MFSQKIAIIELTNMGQLPTIKNLVDAKECDVNQKDKIGYCATIAAANRNSYDILEYLIGVGARVDVEDKFGRSPLSCAKKHKSEKMIALIEATLEKYKNEIKHEPE